MTRTTASPSTEPATKSCKCATMSEVYFGLLFVVFILFILAEGIMRPTYDMVKQINSRCIPAESK